MPDSDGIKKLIFLVGMPGVGKTYGGSRLAQRYGLPFIDLDTVIEQEENMSIPRIFELFGEEKFRELENNHLRDVINNTTEYTIVASGGGTPCFNDNMDQMKAAGTVIYLKADIPYLLDNLTGTEAGRPLLNRLDDLATFLAQTLRQRKGFYEQADHILPIENISLTTFDEIISSCTNRH